MGTNCDGSMHRSHDDAASLREGVSANDPRLSSILNTQPSAARPPSLVSGAASAPSLVYGQPQRARQTVGEEGKVRRRNGGGDGGEKGDEGEKGRRGGAYWRPGPGGPFGGVPHIPQARASLCCIPLPWPPVCVCVRARVCVCVCVRARSRVRALGWHLCTAGRRRRERGLYTRASAGIRIG